MLACGRAWRIGIGGRGDGTDIKICIDGTETISGAYTPKTTTTLQNFRIGDISIQNLTMKIKEVIHIAGVFDQDVYYKVEGYLAWKWGLVANLPYTHSYRNSPPKV